MHTHWKRAPGVIHCVVVLLLGMLVLTARAADDALGAAGHEALERTPVLHVRVVASHPHDVVAFTQGLVFGQGVLLESTGLYGRSTLRRVELETGRVLAQARLPDSLFGEGITLWQDQVVQLTWRGGVGLLHAAADLKQVATFRYLGEGWGITHDGRQWIMSDGGASLAFLDPVSHQVVRRLAVRDHSGPVAGLNELEYVDGEVWANLWPSDRIARIDPQSGRVSAYLDLSDVWPRAERPAGADVLNGIASDPATGRVWVTGKHWPQLFQIEIIER